MARELGSVERQAPEGSTDVMQVEAAPDESQANEATLKVCTEDFKFSRQDPGKLNGKVASGCCQVT